MSLSLVKKATSDEYSLGPGDDAIPNSVLLNNLNIPETKESNALNFELLAENDYFTGIALSILNEDSGRDYKLSLDRTYWHGSLSGGVSDDAENGIIGNIDAGGGNVRKDIYVKAVVDNNGSISSGIFTTPQLKLIATAHIYVGLENIGVI